jgi:hypothetical protein
MRLDSLLVTVNASGLRSLFLFDFSELQVIAFFSDPFVAHNFLRSDRWDRVSTHQIFSCVAGTHRLSLNFGWVVISSTGFSGFAILALNG